MQPKHVFLLLEKPNFKNSSSFLHRLGWAQFKEKIKFHILFSGVSILKY